MGDNKDDKNSDGKVQSEEFGMQITLDERNKNTMQTRQVLLRIFQAFTDDVRDGNKHNMRCGSTLGICHGNENN